MIMIMIMTDISLYILLALSVLHVVPASNFANLATTHSLVIIRSPT